MVVLEPKMIVVLEIFSFFWQLLKNDCGIPNTYRTAGYFKGTPLKM